MCFSLVVISHVNLIIRLAKEPRREERKNFPSLQEGLRKITGKTALYNVLHNNLKNETKKRATNSEDKLYYSVYIFELFMPSKDNFETAPVPLLGVLGRAETPVML